MTSKEKTISFLHLTHSFLFFLRFYVYKYTAMTMTSKEGEEKRKATAMTDGNREMREYKSVSERPQVILIKMVD